jgi:hypothetical protein
MLGLDNSCTFCKNRCDSKSKNSYVFENDIKTSEKREKYTTDVLNDYFRKNNTNLIVGTLNQYRGCGCTDLIIMDKNSFFFH